MYIEVKTTEGDINTPFDISDNEVRVSEEFADNYYIYRVFGIESVICRIKYYRMKGAVKDNFNLIPILYKAYVKTNEI
ncbi:protein NO VEIN domain-containing protein [Clostridium carnis]